jgi:hypothetical protein
MSGSAALASDYTAFKKEAAGLGFVAMPAMKAAALYEERRPCDYSVDGFLKANGRFQEELRDTYKITQGWIVYQSATQWLFRPEDFKPDCRAITRAEFLTEDETSLAVASEGTGKWRVDLFRETEEKGVPVLRSEIEFLFRGEEGKRVRYRRYWRREEDGFVRLCAAPFWGFVDE